MGMKASNAIATFFKYFVLILVGLIMIYPLLWMISATFKDNSEIFAGIGLWIKNPTLEGYKNALNNFGGSINILQAMLNITASADVLPKGHLHRGLLLHLQLTALAASTSGPEDPRLPSASCWCLFLPRVVLNVPQFLLIFLPSSAGSAARSISHLGHCAFRPETYFVWNQLKVQLLTRPDPPPQGEATFPCFTSRPVYVPAGSPLQAPPASFTLQAPPLGRAAPP